MTPKLYKCFCIFVLPWLFIELYPLTNWFLCSFLSKRQHHSQNITLFSWSCLSYIHPVAIKSFFWRVVRPVPRCSMHHSHHCLMEWQQRRLWQSTSRIQIVPDSLFSLLSHLNVSQVMCAHRPSSQLVMLVIAKNGTSKCEFGDGFMSPLATWRPLISHTMNAWMFHASKELGAVVTICVILCINRLHVRLNGMQLTSNAEIDSLHVMSIFLKFFPWIKILEKSKKTWLIYGFCDWGDWQPPELILVQSTQSSN